MENTILPFGDRAVLVQFEQKIDVEVRAAVTALENQLKAAEIPGIAYFIPAYCSLTLGYDPEVLSFEALSARIRMLERVQDRVIPGTQLRSWSIPVCYSEGFALDSDALCTQTGLSWEEIIDLHTQTAFQVFMMGFLPGFAYLGKLPQALFCSRKLSPRLSVPAGSVGLAGFQTGIYPSDAPGGWQIAGRTPVKVFDPRQENPFLFSPGDQVRFCAISASHFLELESAIQSGHFEISSLYV